MGVCDLVLPNPETISDQNMEFLVAFSDLASKIHTHFHTWFLESIPVLRLSDQNG